MASKDNQLEEDIGKFVFLGVILFIVMVIAAIYFSITNSVKIHNRLKDPAHPKHDLLKFIFGIPAALVILSFGIALGGDGEAGGTLFSWTVIGYVLVTTALVMSPTALGPAAPSTALKLERYLYPFELEPPDDRSVLSVPGYVLTRGEKFEQAFRGLRVPPRGPEHDRAKLWEARVRAFQEAMKGV